MSSENNENEFQYQQSLLNKHDYLGWIPNVKANLSYSTINNFSKMNTFSNFSIIGYADKFIANIPFSENVDKSTETFSRLIVCTGFGDIHDVLDTKNKKAKFTRYFLYLKKDIITNHLIGKILFTYTNSEEPSKDELVLLNDFHKIKNISDDYEKNINDFMPYGKLSKDIEENSRTIRDIENSIKDNFDKLEKYSISKNSYLKNNEINFERIHFLVNVTILKSGITLMKLNNNDKDLMQSFHGNSKYYHHTPRHYKIILSLLKEVFHTHSFHGSTEDSIMGCTTIYKGEESYPNKIIRIINHQFNFLYKNILYAGFNNSKEHNKYQIKKLIGRCRYQHSLVSSFCQDKFVDDNIDIKNFQATTELAKNVLLSKQSLLPKMFYLFMLELITISSITYVLFFIITTFVTDTDIDLSRTEVIIDLSRTEVMMFLSLIIFPSMIYRHSIQLSLLSKISLWLFSKIFNYTYLIKEKDKLVYRKPIYKYPWLYTIKLLLLYRKTRLWSLIGIVSLGLMGFYMIAPSISSAFNNIYQHYLVF